jgi:hypothetical protein
MGGLNDHWTLAPYTVEAKYRTAEALQALAGCPDLQDGKELLEILDEYVAMGIWRGWIDTKGRA